MKKYIVFLFVMLVATPVWAQNKTVIRRQRELNTSRKPGQPLAVPGNLDQRDAWNDDGELIDRNFRHNFFFGPVVKFTQVNGEFGLVLGGRTGWIINDNYVLGLGVYGLANDVEANEISSGVTPDLTMGYGGLELEYVIEPEQLVHFSVYTLIGMGFVELDYTSSDGDDTFFVFEPAANVWVNVTNFCKAGLGVGYRLVAGANVEGLESEDLSGLAATLTFKFGGF